MLAIGIDPGKAGGIATLNDAGHAAAYPIPQTIPELNDLVRSLPTPAVALIERLGAMPRRTVTTKCPRCGLATKTSLANQSPTTMFVMGRNYGHLEMAIAAAHIEIHEIAPAQWQQLFGLTFKRSDNLTHTEKKNRHKQAAQKLYPYLKITHKIADALLIANTCYQLYADPRAQTLRA